MRLINRWWTTYFACSEKIHSSCHNSFVTATPRKTPLIRNNRSNRNAEGAHRKQDDKAPKQICRRADTKRRFSPLTTHPLLAENQQPLASDPNFRSNNTGLNKALCVHRGATAGDVNTPETFPSRQPATHACIYVYKQAIRCNVESTVHRGERSLALGSHHGIRIRV